MVEFANEIECDVVGYYGDENYVSIIIFNYVDGKLISKNEQLSPYYDEEIQDVISSYLVQYYSTNKIPKNLYVNLDENHLEGLKNFLEIKVQSTTKAKAVTLLFNYIHDMQKNDLSQITQLQDYDIKRYMALDTATRKNLELLEGNREKTKKVYCSFK